MALYANSALDDRSQDGALLWVDQKGGFRYTDTKGMYLGTVARQGEVVEFADTDYLYQVSREGFRRFEHEGSLDMGHAAVSTSDGLIHVFNSGIDASDGDYMWDFASLSGGRIAGVQRKGELLGTGACNGQAYILMGPWLGSGKKADADLESVVWSGNELVSKSLGRTSLSSRDGYWVGCRDENLLVGVDTRTRSRIYEIDPTVVGKEKLLLDVETDAGVFSHCGTVGDHAYSWAYRSGSLIVDDVSTGVRSGVAIDGLSEDAACSVQGDSVILSNRANDGQLKVFQVEARTGEVVRSVTVTGAADFLNRRGLEALTAPVLLPED